MPHRSRWRPSTIIVTAGALLALTLLAGTGYSLWRERGELVTEAVDQQAVLTRVLEDHASRSLDATQLALGGLANMVERGTPPDMLEALLGQTQATLGYLRSIALIDASGVTVRPLQVAAEASNFVTSAEVVPLLNTGAMMLQSRKMSVVPVPEQSVAVPVVPLEALPGLRSGKNSTPSSTEGELGLLG